MRKLFELSLLVWVCWSTAILAQGDQQIARMVTVPSNLPPPPVDAIAWTLMEVTSGWVVAGKNADQPLPPASITKLMTNYVVFDALKKGQISLNDQVSISEKAWRAEGSRMFADVDTQIKLEHLLKSTIVQSGNDAAIALAEHTGGSELGFTARMNQAGVKLGLKNSYFANSTGLPAEGHSMSANDIATLSAAVIREFPEFYTWYSEKRYTHNGITQYNRNKLLWKDASVDGLKTGHTEAAGFCLVGSALRNGQRWVAVVLGSVDEKTREAAVLNLLNYAFAAYQPVRLLDQQGGVTSAAVYKGEVDEVRLQSAGPVNVVVPRGREQDIAVEIKISPYYLAPIDVGQAVGLVSLSLDGEMLSDVPLHAMSSIKTGGLWKRMKDSVHLQVRKWTSD